MISQSQRGLFFLFVKVLGREKVYDVLSQVTRGITSLRDTHLSKWMMHQVLSELIYSNPGVLFERTPQIRENGDCQEKGTGNLVLLMTLDQRNAISIQKRILRLSEQGFADICMKRIEKPIPQTSEEAFQILDELHKRIASKWVK